MVAIAYNFVQQTKVGENYNTPISTVIKNLWYLLWRRSKSNVIKMKCLKAEIVIQEHKINK